MRLQRWDPIGEFDSANKRLNRTVDHFDPNRIENSFGPWAVDILSRQDHKVEKLNPKMTEIKSA